MAVKAGPLWKLRDVERRAVYAQEWSWRVGVDPDSKHFGCLQLKGGHVDWSYIHGNYDLKDVIVPGHESDNQHLDMWRGRVKNYIPDLPGKNIEDIRGKLNVAMGVEMVQHGSERSSPGTGTSRSRSCTWTGASWSWVPPRPWAALPAEAKFVRRAAL